MAKLVIVYPLQGEPNRLLPSGKFGLDLIKDELYLGTGKKNIKITSQNQDSGWLPLMPLQNEWEIYSGGLGFRISSSGVINVRGSVKNGVLNKPIARLPENARPTQETSFVQVSSQGFMRVDINAQGFITPRANIAYTQPSSPDEQGEAIPVGFLNLEFNFLR